MPGIKPGAAGREASMLPLCYAVPNSSLSLGIADSRLGCATLSPLLCTFAAIAGKANKEFFVTFKVWSISFVNLP